MKMIKKTFIIITAATISLANTLIAEMPKVLTINVEKLTEDQEILADKFIKIAQNCPQKRLSQSRREIRNLLKKYENSTAESLYQVLNYSDENRSNPQKIAVKQMHQNDCMECLGVYATFARISLEAKNQATFPFYESARNIKDIDLDGLLATTLFEDLVDFFIG